MFRLPRTALALRPLGLILAAAVGVVVSAQSTQPTQSTQSTQSTGTASLAVPGRTNAHVSIAVQERFVVAAWAASLPTGSTDIYAAVSRDGGVTFGPPTRVNSTPGDARVNGEQPPRVALAPRAGSDPVVTVLWTSKGASGTTLLTARSDDGGRSFMPSALVAGTDAPGNRGWQAIATDRTGAVHAMWLDHRELAATDTAKPSGGTHTHAGHGVGDDLDRLRGARRPDRRRRDGPALEAVHRRPWRRWGRHGAASDHRRGLLLLQDGAGHERRRDGVRRMAACVPGQPSRHRLLDVERRWTDLQRTDSRA